MKRIKIGMALVLSAALIVGGCAGIQQKWDNFIVVACENYDVFKPAIERGVKTLQTVFDLIIAGWPEASQEAPEFVVAAQVILAGLTQALSAMAKVCPHEADVEAVEQAVKKVESSSVVKLAKAKARLNLAKRQGKQ